MEKPKCKLIGEDGNVFNIIGRVTRSLEKSGMKDKAEEFAKKALASQTYDEVLRLAMEYVKIR